MSRDTIASTIRSFEDRVARLERRRRIYKSASFFEGVTLSWPADPSYRSVEKLYRETVTLTTYTPRIRLRLDLPENTSTLNAAYGVYLLQSDEDVPDSEIEGVVNDHVDMIISDTEQPISTDTRIIMTDVLGVRPAGVWFLGMSYPFLGYSPAWAGKRRSFHLYAVVFDVTADGSAVVRPSFSVVPI